MNVFLKRYFFVIAFWVSFAGSILAQPRNTITHYSTEDGLSHDIINYMFKDSEGFMWFSTWDGINRFDGHTFLSFKSSPGDRSPLKNDRIDKITEDRSGHLWLKCYDGQIYRFDKSTHQFESLASIFKIKEQVVFDDIIACEGNSLWLSTLTSGLIYVPDTMVGASGYYSYREKNSGGFRLPSNKLNFFHKDSKGTIWLGTPKGLVYLDKDKNGVFQSRISSGKYSSLDYTAVAEGDGKLYFATTQGQLVIFDNNGRTFSALALSAGSLNAVQLEKDNSLLYAVTSIGEVIRVNTTNFNISSSVFIKGEPLQAIFEDSEKNLWIEPDKVGVIRFNTATNTFKRFSQLTDAKYVHGINHFKVFEDNKGIVWVALKDGGFGYYDKGADNLAYFFNDPSLPNRILSNIVHCINYDADGIVWLSTDLGGIEKVIFQPNNFNRQLLIDPGAFKSDNDVRGLLCDRKNRLWIGAKSGRLYVYDNGRPVAVNFTNPPQNGFGLVYTIMQDHTGAIWLGTKSNGVYRAEPVNSSETQYKLSHYESVPENPQTLSSNQVYALLEDVKGRVWIGTYDGGLNLATPFNGGFKFSRLPELGVDKLNATKKIRCLRTGKDGNLWIGTTTGLAVLDINHPGYKFRTFRKEPGNINSLGNNDVQFIYRDSKAQMWLATSGGGLNLAKGNPFSADFKFKVFTKMDGLPNDYLLSCIEDLDHNLWVATQSGLSRFNPVTGRFQNYNSYDGVPKVAFSEESCQQMKDGTLVFGTIRGYLWFKPETIKDNPIYARFAFTDFQVNNEHVNSASAESILKGNINRVEGIELNYRQNIFSIDYAVLDFRGNDKQTYFYRLKNFDNNWQNNQNQRRVTFTNLPPGKYQLEVKSVNQDLYSNIPVKTLSITILPPPWRTWWAYLLYLLMAAAIVEIIRRSALTMLRLRQRIAIEHQLTELKVKFFTNISHELRTPLTLILNPLEEIAKREQLSHQGNQYLQVVRRNASRMTRFINQLLDLRKVQSGKAKLNLSIIDVVAFVKDTGEYFNELSREKNIALNIVSDAAVIYAWLDADKIETVIYNLVSNAYKFTPEGKAITVHITMDEENKQLRIDVSDEGKGVHEDELKDIFELYYEGKPDKSDHAKGTGIGLALSKELIELHQGIISAYNNTNGGLTVSITLPLTKPEPGTMNPDERDDLLLLTGDSETAIRAEIEEVPGVYMSHSPLVLLVEDNLDMRMFLHIQLKEFYRVEVAENGQEGLEKARLMSPDIVISDIMMPVMDGIQMLNKLKEDPTTSHIPVVLLSAKSAVESQIEGIQYGADYYITKPFNNDFLLATIANILNNRRKIAESLMTGKKGIELNPGEIVITSKDETFLNRILEIVENKMADPDFNIDTVAEMINMGRTAFFRKFKGLTQMAPVEFVRDMRLKRAAQYFDGGNDNIAEVGYIVGFNSSKYFSTCFRAKYHLSPSDYLKAKQSKAAG
jgi:signal transduction histidine kinase/ligand-binding sensor domain-containing protein/CheY-like chemotaxis protein/AraC-like DNA-binding protein